MFDAHVLLLLALIQIWMEAAAFLSAIGSPPGTPLQDWQARQLFKAEQSLRGPLVATRAPISSNDQHPFYQVRRDKLRVGVFFIHCDIILKIIVERVSAHLWLMG